MPGGGGDATGGGSLLAGSSKCGKKKSQRWIKIEVLRYSSYEPYIGVSESSVIQLEKIDDLLTDVAGEAAVGVGRND